MENKIVELTAKLEEMEKLLEKEVKRRIELEEEYRASKQTFKRALKELPVIITATDDDGSIIFFNHEFERVSGYNAIDMANNTDAQKLLFPDNDTVTSSESSIGKEWKFKNKDGSEKNVVWSNISEYLPILGWKTWQVGIDITELKKALGQLKILSGFLPICSVCKKIRNEVGGWVQIEEFIREHSEAEFSHGLCPACSQKYYAEYLDPEDP